MKRYIHLTVFLSVMMILAACGGKENADNKRDGKLTIYTTIYPLSYFTEEIGKEHVDVESILPAGADAHTFEPTSKTMIDIAGGDMFIYNGLGLEPFGDKVKETMKSESVNVLEVGKSMDLTALQKDHHKVLKQQDHSEEEQVHNHEDGHHHGSADPHVWIDPVLSIEMAETIKDELVKLQPENKAKFQRNYEELKSKLEKLDQDFHEMAEGAAHKQFLVSHSAFGYWEDHYGIEQIGVAGLSPANEPSQKQLKEIIETAKKHRTKFVIFEQNITPKVAQVVQNEINAKALHIHNAAVLTEEDKRNKENYFTLMEKNIQTLKKAME
ncbi:metal ABC transporter solute-binding protein, Zn/Mn family [Bacillus xiapuensis]|uniref:metal ABC transporter solute-binding protein, Zn/Mn family n=1 Tax=Bacillus xiapuensis TaxID=2014075 RepID=UPI000C24FFBA|nr:zinc ABC transporter substrate-binding protein [Bacillus xiapuensis]